MEMGDKLAFTVYALSFDSEMQDTPQIWPLEGTEVEIFERIITTFAW